MLTSNLVQVGEEKNIRLAIGGQDPSCDGLCRKHVSGWPGMLRKTRQIWEI